MLCAMRTGGRRRRGVSDDALRVYIRIVRRKSEIDKRAKRTYADHFANGNDVTDHSRVHVNSNGVEQISVQILSADETGEADSRVLSQVLDRHGDGECQREYPAECCEVCIVRV